jgi:hypothetical protein
MDRRKFLKGLLVAPLVILGAKKIQGVTGVESVVVKNPTFDGISDMFEDYVSDDGQIQFKNCKFFNCSFLEPVPPDKYVISPSGRGDFSSLKEAQHSLADKNGLVNTLIEIRD